MATESSLLFAALHLQGAWLIDPVPTYDDRGYFARTFCAREFLERGLESTFVQHSRSFSARKGTLRGMHFQHPPCQEVKVVSCPRGAIFDVIVDLRPNSKSFRRWQGFDLTAGNRRKVYVPRGFAHGFQTLLDDTEVNYLISEFYTPLAADGIRYDDPALGIAWPLPVTAISERDKAWPTLPV